MENGLTICRIILTERHCGGYKFQNFSTNYILQNFNQARKNEIKETRSPARYVASKIWKYKKA